MKLHIVTIGQPKLEYAKLGWQEYWRRLSRYHQIRVTHVPDKHDDAEHILQASADSYRIVLEIDGRLLTSHQLADFLRKKELEAREVSFIIGGPDGLPEAVKQQADFQLSFGKLTLPHDLAMVMLLETLYRSSTINAGQPYHR